MTRHPRLLQRNRHIADIPRLSSDVRFWGKADMRRTSLNVSLGDCAAVPSQSTIGFIHSASPDYFAPFAKDFHAGLKEAGYAEGQNVTIESRWAEGHYERLPELVADLLERNVSVIFAAGGTDPAKAAKAATSTTPIVFDSAA